MRQKFTDKHKMFAYIMMNDPSVRQNKTITQNEIASLFGVSQSTVASILRFSSSCAISPPPIARIVFVSTFKENTRSLENAPCGMLSSFRKRSIASLIALFNFSLNSDGFALISLSSSHIFRVKENKPIIPPNGRAFRLVALVLLSSLFWLFCLLFSLKCFCCF